MGDKDEGKHEGKPHEYKKITPKRDPHQGDGLAQGGGKRESGGKGGKGK
ncbi:hypothetical protein [Nonomuraea jiangxiensis]|uniref:Uncharacterized protein n=1 Tax=Nonomuraea jiangxiensis TaxID=633440 RepID=A0A1G8T2H8_9ACTN|nr:hypothetical protein [Nonomuraea jiangxiensis]SDJ35694.1 hypothetical protein SAMN05421869_11049 [Nonomuraea jiangxiensis]